jgi:hypothetical protein
METTLILQAAGTTLEDRIAALTGVTQIRICSAYVHLATIELLNRFPGVPKMLLFDYDPRMLTEGLLSALVSVADSIVYVADIEELFHPKVYLLDTAETLHFILGSNNATGGGLRRNVEVAAHHRVDRAADAAVMQEVETLWTSLQRIAGTQLTEALINERRDELARTLPRGKTTRYTRKLRQRSIALDFPPTQGGRATAVGQILIAELPGGTNRRWYQANFSKRYFEDFFHANIRRTATLQNVDIAGTPIGGLEQRPLVQVRSQNYRIELAAGSGRPYPAGGRRPIALFGEIAPGVFRYILAMPGSQEHRRASAALALMPPPPGTQVRRGTIDAPTLAARWPEVVAALLP